MGQILREYSAETLRRKRDIVSSVSTMSAQEDSSSEYENCHEYNMRIVVDIVETDYQEVENEFSDLIVEIEGAKVFPCSKCSKICKSKGGLTKHTNSKHSDPDKDSSPMNATPLCFDTMKSIVDTIKQSIITEKLYGDELERCKDRFSDRSVVQGNGASLH